MAEGTSIASHCLMGNHFHLVLHCPDAGLSTTMARLSSTYTRAFNRRHGLAGPLFRNRFHSKAVQTSEQLLVTCRYLDRNPLELGYRLADYPWSSHADFLAASVTSWARPDLVLPLIGTAADYRDFVVGSFDGDKFHVSDGVRVWPRTAPHRVALTELSASIDRHAPSGFAAAQRRDAFLLLSRSLLGETSSEVAAWLDMRSAAAVRAARARAGERLLSDNTFAQFVTTVRDGLGQEAA